jgi:hypothetical protein
MLTQLTLEQFGVSSPRISAFLAKISAVPAWFWQTVQLDGATFETVVSEAAV